MLTTFLDNEFMTSGGIMMICVVNDNWRSYDMRKLSTGEFQEGVIENDSLGTGIHCAIREDELLGERSQHTAESSPLHSITIII
jgi:hypothetical protein